MQLVYSLIDETSCTNSFDCGNEELNLFLKNLALLYQRRRFAVSVVSSEINDPKKRIIGYYTVCPACIERGHLPDKMFKGPRPNPIPGFRLCRLAVDKPFQDKGYGKMLFVHALKKCYSQAQSIGGSVIMIDAKNENAKHFYECFGFIPLDHNPLVLVQTIKYLEKHFDQQS